MVKRKGYKREGVKRRGEGGGGGNKKVDRKGEEKVG